MAGERTPRRHLRVVPDLGSLSDEDLMCRYRDGEVAAFDSLVHRHRGGLHRYLLRLTRDRDRAEELVADVFLKIHRAAPRYEPTAKFSTYLYTVAYRAGLNHKARMSHRRDFGTAEPGELEQHADPSPRRANPEREVRLKRDFTALSAELDRLPETHRSAFVLYYLQGLACAEIADVLGITADEAKGRLAYARKLLRSRLTGAQRENSES